jgi:outer membrane lipoprotein SlyB
MNRHSPNIVTEVSMQRMIATIVSAAAAALLAGAALAQQPPQNVIPAPAVACSDCGVVQSVRQVEQQGSTSGAGAVVGGVLGGVLGHQIGSGRGNTVATIAGAGAGAVAGNAVERNRNTTQYWEVRVAMDGGNTRTFHYNSQPSAREGDRVRLIDNGRSLQLLPR